MFSGLVAEDQDYSRKLNVFNDIYWNDLKYI